VSPWLKHGNRESAQPQNWDGLRASSFPICVPTPNIIENAALKLAFCLQMCLVDLPFVNHPFMPPIEQEHFHRTKTERKMQLMSATHNE
jgi:hypothetical protein